MARIPISEIPDAPQVARGIPMIPAGGGKVSLLGVADEYMQDTMPLDAFSGGAEGLERLGAAGKAVAGVLQDVAVEMTAFRNEAGYAEADRLRSEMLGNFEESKQDRPPSEWTSAFEKEEASFRKKLDGISLSPRARKQLEADQIRWAANQTLQVKKQAIQENISRGRAEIVAASDRDVANGNLESAEARWARGIKNGWFIQAEYDEWKLNQDLKQQDDNLALAMQNNAKALAKTLENAKETADDFKAMPDTKRQTWLARARREAKTQAQESFFGAQNAVASGEAESLDDVKRMFPGIEPRQLKLVERQLSANREYDPAKDGPVFAKTRAMILDYSGRDDADGSRARSIEEQISTLPKREAGMLSSAFQQQWSSTWKDGKDKTTQQRLLGYWTKEITRYAESYWETGRDKKSFEKIVDPAKSQAFGERLNNSISALEGWSKRNPEATPEQWKAQLSNVIGEDAAESAAKGYQETSGQKSGEWWQFLYPGDVDSLRSSPDNPVPTGQIKEKLGPASIRYNNPGAQYPGPSSERFGATEVRTIGGGHKIAVFPDAESGAAAQFDLLNRSYTGKTVRDAVTKWSGGNSVAAYLRTIKQDAGLDAETILTREMLQDPKVAIPLVRAMARHEAGQEYPLSEEQWKNAHMRAFKKS